MKKTIIPAIVIAALVGGWCWIWWGLGIRDVHRGGIAAAFAGDLAAFVTDHQGRLPSDWGEFEDWQTKRDGKTRWEADATAQRVVLLDPPFEMIDGRVPKVVDVIDPQIEGLESMMNRRVWSARLALTNGANKPSHHTVDSRADATVNGW